MPPKEYAEFHGIEKQEAEKPKENFLQLLKMLQKFLTVGLAVFLTKN